MVDDDTEPRGLGLAALAEPSRLGGTGLVVDQHGDTVDRSKDLLGLNDPGPVPDLDVAR